MNQFARLCLTLLQTFFLGIWRNKLHFLVKNTNALKWSRGQSSASDAGRKSPGVLCENSLRPSKSANTSHKLVWHFRDSYNPSFNSYWVELESVSHACSLKTPQPVFALKLKELFLTFVNSQTPVWIDTLWLTAKTCCGKQFCSVWVNCFKQWSKNTWFFQLYFCFVLFFLAENKQPDWRDSTMISLFLKTHKQG